MRRLQSLPGARAHNFADPQGTLRGDAVNLQGPHAGTQTAKRPGTGAQRRDHLIESVTCYRPWGR